MKKATILILIAVYLGSIFVVGIFGMKNMPYEEIVPIKTIIPTSVTLSSGENLNLFQKKEEENAYYITITNFVIPENQEGMIIILNYQLNPADATTKDLDIFIEHTTISPTESVVEIDNGRIIIKQPATIKLRFQEKNRPNGTNLFFYIYFI